ncbi:helix-turn-helix transcriptional regulator [Actinomyces faecalis]|uniref:helix-turn-helix transcriptional regulator n=1 Tax=Actinomyces faecalis TaxID=2722820 RepID=UPI001FD3D22A|nr:WYL domain-containing protein [Actinomyces faecalis]
MTTSPHVRAEERQINLLLALRATQTGLSATEVVTRVEGYDPEAGESARRMFERDKNELRALGVPILVTGPDTQPRYRVDEDSYALPPLRLDAEQAAAIELAASAWRDGELPAAARRALTKLRAVSGSQGEGGTQETGALTDLTVDLAGREVPAELAAAVDERRVVAFDYTSASSGHRRRRTVEPERLWMREGAWYLEGRDRQAGERRTFRLARLSGGVEVLTGPGAFEPAEPRQDRGHSAVLALRPGRGLALRARAQRQERRVEGYDVVRVGYDDLFSFAGSLAALGDGVLVLEPAGLHDLVREHLRGAAALAGSQQASTDAVRQEER